MSDGTTFPAEALRVVSGPAKESVIPIPDGELQLGCEAGRLGALGGDLALSRRHASISHDADGRLVVEDLGSTNGTFVNGSQVDGLAPVSFGDELQVGQVRLRLERARA
jgi:pSer/pThr/pTyr-binding forkhead associated (FHA) protein